MSHLPLQQGRLSVAVRGRRFLAALFLGALATSPVLIAQPSAGGVVAVPGFDGGGATDELTYFELASGRGFLVDRLRREPRARRLEPSLFQAVGRPTEQPAIPGELLLLPIRNGNTVRAVLFAEASTGYVAYFEDFGKGGKLGSVTTTIGRPFERLAATDGNFVLLERRDGGGRTQGAYVYHAGSGRGFYLDGLAKLSTSPDASAVEGLPVLGGQVTAAGLETRNGENVGYLLADNTAGDLFWLTVDAENPRRLGVRKGELNLFQALPREPQAAAGSRRFLLIALHRDEQTQAVLVIDVGTGKTAVLENVQGAGAPVTLRPLALDVGRLLGPEEPRSVTAVPVVDGGGTTFGAWLLSGSAPSFVYVDGLTDPAGATAATVRVARE